jgi:hypothetical protein
MKLSKSMWGNLIVLVLVASGIMVYTSKLFAGSYRSLEDDLVVSIKGRGDGGGGGPGRKEMVSAGMTTEMAAEMAAEMGRVEQADALREMTAPGWLDADWSIGPPKVALLFLTKNTMQPLESIWTDWLEASPIDWRLIFDVHVHVSEADSPASVLRYPKDSVFHRSVLKEHFSIQWGNHSMVDAERALFKQAMKNSQVETFVLLSDDSAPLYPAILSYMQLILEPKSRVNACGDPSTGDSMSYRWVPRMADAGLSQDLWRKSSQWVALKRPLVETVLSDKDLDRIFADECYVCTGPSCEVQRFCVSDEHYIPSLLALKGLESECACDGMATMTRWEQNSPHPKTFGLTDVQSADNDQVIREEMRDGWNEAHDCGTLRSGLFDDWAEGKLGNGLSVGESGQTEALWKVLTWDGDKRNRLMHPGCPLFIRKMSTQQEAVAAWRAALERYIV